MVLLMASAVVLCTGLAQFMQPQQLAGALVCVVANLKPAKLAGQASEAMVLAAEAADSSGQLIVRTLLPPGERSR
jgi:aminoacyl tRNA synthase complex-interacting multifunctional protein 1